MGGGVVWIAVKNLLAGAEGVSGIVADLDLGLGEERRSARGAEDFLEKTFAFAGLGKLDRAESFATGVESGFAR